jgi:transcription elongation factor Elf1
MTIAIVQDGDSERCPSCGHEQISLKVIDHLFEYNNDYYSVKLKTTLPVFVCGHCKLEFINECGQALMEHAIVNYIKSLVPETVDEIIERSR